MLDRILQQAEQALTKLNQSLSLFELDFNKLKKKFEEDKSGVEKSAEEYIVRYQKDLYAIIHRAEEDLKNLRSDYDSALEVEKMRFAKNIAEIFKTELEKARMQALKDAEGFFESDVSKLFEKNADKMAPVIRGMFLKNIFGKKS